MDQVEKEDGATQRAHSEESPGRHTGAIVLDSGIVKIGYLDIYGSF